MYLYGKVIYPYSYIYLSIYPSIYKFIYLLGTTEAGVHDQVPCGPVRGGHPEHHDGVLRAQDAAPRLPGPSKPTRKVQLYNLNQFLSDVFIRLLKLNPFLFIHSLVSSFIFIVFSIMNHLFVVSEVEQSTDMSYTNARC